MIQEDEATAELPDFDPTFRFPSLCAKLQTCVCSADGAEAFHFHKNMISLVKPFLAAKRRGRKRDAAGRDLKNKQPAEKPPARKLLESGFLVLRLRTTERWAAKQL